MGYLLRQAGFTDQWNKLPNEIQIAIIEQVVLHLDLEGLKQMRTSGKLFSRAATVKLFHTLHLSPDVQSCKRAQRVAGIPRLAACVKDILLHRSGLIDHPDLQTGFEYFHARHQGFHGDSTVFDQHRVMARLWHGYLEQLAAQREFMRSDWVALLRDLCTNLPNLKGIMVAPEMHMMRTSRPSFLARQTGHEESYVRAFSIPDVLEAAEQIYPHRLEMGDLTWVELQRLPSTPLMKQFAGLRKLQISLNSCEFRTHQSVQILAAWSDFLDACSGIQELDLDFKLTPFKHLRGHLSCVMETVTTHNFPQLQHLIFRNVCMREHAFEQFLRNHRHSLRTVELHGWEIPLPTELTDLPGSIVRAFWFMNKYLSLQHVSLLGDFSNKTDEAWIAKKCMDRYCLRRQIEDFICHRAAFPFGEFEPLLHLSHNRFPLIAIAECRRRLKLISDSSWRFCTELIL